MEMTHIKPFTEAMARKDLESMLTHMTDDIFSIPRSRPNR
jgi:ketosteroid isomerase-like protein